MTNTMLHTLWLLAVSAAFVPPNQAATSRQTRLHRQPGGHAEPALQVAGGSLSHGRRSECVKASAKKPAELSKAAAELGQTYKSLQTRVDSVQTNAVIAKARVKEHYDAWSKELTGMPNPKLREKAQERLTKSQKEFDKIVVKGTVAKEQVLPFVSQVKDVVIYLGADVSEEAVKSLSNDIWKLDGKAAAVNGSIKDVIDQIDRTIKSLPQK